MPIDTNEYLKRMGVSRPRSASTPPRAESKWFESARGVLNTTVRPSNAADLHEQINAILTRLRSGSRRRTYRYTRAMLRDKRALCATKILRSSEGA